MTRHTAAVGRLMQAVATPTNGVLGLVDELLAAAQDRPLRLDWHEGRGRLQFQDDNAAEATDVSLPKSVVRAVLARIATLCNEHRPNSVTHYRGSGEVRTAAGLVRAVFVNTPDDQQLELAPAAELRAASGADPTARTRTPSCSAAPR